jgi:hypothetical protein
MMSVFDHRQSFSQLKVSVVCVPIRVLLFRFLYDRRNRWRSLDHSFDRGILFYLLFVFKLCLGAFTDISKVFFDALYFDLVSWINFVYFISKQM